MTKNQVDSAIRFTATAADLKEIRKAFESVNPAAHRWRKPDDDPDQEYYSSPIREAFYNFRDGWLAARAQSEPGARHIKTWRERCDELHDDMVIVSSSMVQQRMQEEIDDLRAALNREGSL